MSKFSTILPTDTEEFIKSLPKDTYIHGIAFDMEKKAIVVLWENERFDSGLTVPVHVTATQAKTKKFPAGVKDLKHPEPAIIPPILEELPPLPEPVKEAPKYLNESEYRANLIKQVSMEFIGTNPFWLPVDRKHTFTEGFFYRVAKPVDKLETVAIK